MKIEDANKVFDLSFDIGNQASSCERKVVDAEDVKVAIMRLSFPFQKVGSSFF